MSESCCCRVMYVCVFEMNSANSFDLCVVFIHKFMIFFVFG